MKFWKEHGTLRMVLMAAFFISGMALIILGWGAFDKVMGWTMSGKLVGMIVMLVGIAFLLAALAIYNKPFGEPKTRKKKTN